MKTLRYVLLIFALLITTGHLFVIDYKNPAWSENAGAYLGILAMVLLIVSMLLQIRQDRKKEKL